MGKAAIISWDSEIFGFPVACYQIGLNEPSENARAEFHERLESWLLRNHVLLCMCAVPANRTRWKSFVTSLGFSFVDFNLQPTLNGLQRLKLLELRTAVRHAELEDRTAIANLAGHAFHHGRYHVDSQFPRRLADLRYRQWITNALASDRPSDRVYVMGGPGKVEGFFHVVTEGTGADLRLAAVAPELQRTMAGVDLYVAVLHALKGLGIRRATSIVSTANTGVMNIHSVLGFSFSNPEVIYHWHSEQLCRLGV
jgi:hypothetical protein